MPWNQVYPCLPSYYLEYLLKSINVPLYYVPGNHDEQAYQPKGPFAQGCINIDERVIAFEGLLIGGLEGGFRVPEWQIFVHRKANAAQGLQNDPSYVSQ